MPMHSINRAARQRIILREQKLQDFLLCVRTIQEKLDHAWDKAIQLTILIEIARGQITNPILTYSDHVAITQMRHHARHHNPHALSGIRDGNHGLINGKNRNIRCRSHNAHTTQSTRRIYLSACPRENNCTQVTSSTTATALKHPLPREECPPSTGALTCA